MTELFPHRFLLIERAADIAAAMVAAGVCFALLNVRHPPLALASWALLWFGPGVWVIVRLLPAVRRLTNPRLRQDLAVTPLAPRGFLQKQLRPRLYRALLPGVVILIMLISQVILTGYEQIYILLYLPLIVLWFVNQDFLAALALLLLMRGLLRPRQKLHEAVWIAGAVAAQIGLTLGVALAGLFLLRLVGLGSLLIPLVALMALPFYLYNHAFAQWEHLCREYFQFE